jgi:hypothetical protein
MPDSYEDLIALVLGLVVLWFLVGVFSHDVPSGDHRGSLRRVKGGPRS